MPDFDDVYQKAKRRHDDEMKQRAAAQETARAAREAEIDAAAKVLADSFLPVLKAARTTLKKNGLTLEIDGDDTAKLRPGAHSVRLAFRIVGPKHPIGEHGQFFEPASEHAAFISDGKTVELVISREASTLAHGKGRVLVENESIDAVVGEALEKLFDQYYRALDKESRLT